MLTPDLETSSIDWGAFPSSKPKTPKHQVPFHVNWSEGTITSGSETESPHKPGKFTPIKIQQEV